MKAVIATTYDSKYLYFLPVVTWCWNKLNVDVICFMPHFKTQEQVKAQLVRDTIDKIEGKIWYKHFSAPEHKEATYAQCSRLYAACLDLPENEVLITSDVDMAVFDIPLPDFLFNGISILGSDLVPKNQYPICYLMGTVNDWRKTFELGNVTYQESLDNLLGHIEAEHFRGNYWGKDQEEAYSKISKVKGYEITRSNGQNQFATKRYDRDDAYILDRLNPDTIDFHMPRPGFEEHNFNIILAVLKYHYPHDNFDWLIEYTKQYNELL